MSKKKVERVNLTPDETMLVLCSYLEMKGIAFESVEKIINVELVPDSEGNLRYLSFQYVLK